MKFQKNVMIIQNERGVALLIAMMMLIMLTLIGIAAIMTSTTDINIAGNVKNSTNALFQAESGIEEVKMRLNPNAASVFTGMDTYSCTPTPSCTASWHASWGKYVLTPGKSATADPNYNSGYAVTTSVQGSANWDWVKVGHLTDNASPPNVMCYRPGLPPSPCLNANDVPIENITAVVNSKGTTKQIQVQLRPLISPKWGSAGFGAISVTMAGNASTNSYASTTGGTPSPTCGTSGSVQTNGTASGAITMSGNNVKICGTATVGTGGTVGSSISQGGGTITGGTCVAGTIPSGSNCTATSNVSVTTPSYPNSLCPTLSTLTQASFNNNAPTNITATATNCFVISGDLKLNGNASTIVTFPAGSQVYFTGQLEIEGQAKLTSATGLPADLQLLGTSTATEVEVEGNGVIVGAVNAPTAGAEISGNGVVYGAVSGNTLNMSGNGVIHYDTNLQNVGTVASYTNYSWNQVQ